MKILSGKEGDGLLTNVEVMEWVREKSAGAAEGAEVEEGELAPPSNFVEISKELLAYFSKAPSGNQTVASVQKLFAGLQKFRLSSPELLMIANIRPEGYDQITPLIIDIRNRFDDDQVYEILEVVKTTLEPRPPPDDDQTEPTQANGVPGTEVDSAAIVQQTEDLALEAPVAPGATNAESP